MGKRTRVVLAGAGVALTAAVTLAQPAAAGVWPTLRSTHMYEFNCVDAGNSGILAGRWRDFDCYRNPDKAWFAWELYA